MPVFGICRGIQVLNVAYGGELIQDIEASEGIAREEHAQPEPYSNLKHEVQFSQDSLISRITGMDRFMTNSMHHQSIKHVGGSLVIEGRTADGIVEAVSDRNDPATFGVQFHPEFFADTHEYAQKLFDYFVARAAEYKESK